MTTTTVASPLSAEEPLELLLGDTALPGNFRGDCWEFILPRTPAGSLVEYRIRFQRHTEVAQGPFAETEPPGLRERAPEERQERPEPLRREEDGLVGRTRRADGAAGARQVADQGLSAAALDAALDVRDVAGEPEQLQLKGERQRVERGAPP